MLYFFTEAVQRRFVSFCRLQTLFLHCNWRYYATVVGNGPLLLRPDLALQVVWVKTAQTFSESWQVIGPVNKLCLLVVLDLIIVLRVLGQLFKRLPLYGQLWTLGIHGLRRSMTECDRLLDQVGLHLVPVNLFELGRFYR